MSIMRKAAAALLMMGVLNATPTMAQFSETYQFLKAVRDKDSAKAKELLDKPGTTVVNARDRETDETALIIATKRGDLTWMGYMLNAGANANLRDREGNSPLMLAALAGFSPGVELLLAVRAQPDLANNQGETPLIRAVQVRNVGIAKLLLDAGADPDQADHAAGYSARQYAMQDGRNGQMAKLLAETPPRKKAQQQGPSL